MQTQTFTHSLEATGAGVQKRFVTFDGKQAVANDPILGVAVTDFSPGQLFTAHILGAVYVEAGGAVAAGEGVASDAQGRAIKANDNPFARALNSVNAPGQSLFILIK